MEGMNSGVGRAFLGDTRTTDESRLPSAGPTIRTTEVCVLLTSIEETRSAIRIANDLARAMAASLTLIDFRPTHYPLQSPGDSAEETKS